MKNKTILLNDGTIKSSNFKLYSAWFKYNTFKEDQINVKKISGANND